MAIYGMIDVSWTLRKSLMMQSEAERVLFYLFIYLA